MTFLLVVMACGIFESARFRPVLNTFTCFSLVCPHAVLLPVTSRIDMLNLVSFTISRISHVFYIRFTCHFISNTFVMGRRVGQLLTRPQSSLIFSLIILIRDTGAGGDGKAKRRETTGRFCFQDGGCINGGFYPN